MTINRIQGTFDTNGNAKECLTLDGKSHSHLNLSIIVNSFSSWILPEPDYLIGYYRLQPMASHALRPHKLGFFSHYGCVEICANVVCNK